jgi:membrane peptidoglycan carboxypeptidase
MGAAGVGIIIALMASLLLLAAGLAYANLTHDLPNIESLPILLNPPDGLLLQPTRIYDRSGQHLLATLAPTDETRRYLPLNPQSPQHLPDALAKATVAAADPGFWVHGGYVVSGWNNPDLHPTLAQRLVSELLLYNEGPSLRRALRERILAAQATAKYGRSQILEWVLNSADYGNEAFGAEAAAQIYFGKPAIELDLAEAAMLAATAEAPNLNPLDAPEEAKQGRNTTLESMKTLGMIAEDEAAQAMSEAVPSPGPLKEPVGGIAPAFLHMVRSQLDQQFARERIERGGVKITTTLDYELQAQAACTTLAYGRRLAGAADPSTECAGAARLPALAPGTTVVEPSASALITDPETGQVLAAVGETQGEVETASLAAHEPGTLMNTFIYLTAFARGLSPASMVWDIPPADEAPSPGAAYHGPVRMRIALANDFGVPAEKVTAQMGADAIGRTESSFGLDPASDSLVDIASAYGTFAARGVRYGQPGPSTVLRVEGLDHSVWLDLSIPEAQAVLASPLAYLINNVLSDDSARAASLGHPNPLELERPSAAKVGQTASGADSWTVGYTPSRLAAVWIGTRAAAPAPIPSARVAASLWNALITMASESEPPEGWLVPAGVTAVDVCDPSGLLPTKDCPSIVSEVFLSGNEPVQTDTLYQRFAVNRETGYLATVFTPPGVVEERVYMVLPPEAQAWAQSANVPAAPTAYDAIQAAPINPGVRVTAPAMFASVSGQVQIRGTAAGVGFSRYRILVGQGINPESWMTVGNESSTPVEDGLLATWDTTGLSGLYAVQLQVIRADQRVDTAILQVTVNSK